jgi:hypothetical protein
MDRKTTAKSSKQLPGYRPAAQTRGVWAYVGADASSARPSDSSASEVLSTSAFFHPAN